MSIHASAFPPLPDCAVTGAPLFLEPISGSGERVCVALAARDSIGNWRVSPIVNEQLAKCMLGDQADALLGFVQLGVASLEKHLESGALLQRWASPVHGMQLGPIASGRVVDLAMMLRTLARNHAFLASLAEFAADTTEDSTASDNGAERWLKQVRDAVSQRNPFLDGRFSKPVKLTDTGTKTRFDYLGTRLVAQLGRLIPNRAMSGQVQTAKAKLWDLKNLRDSGHLLAPAESEGYELLLYRPSDDDPAYSDSSIRNLHDAICELEAAGDRQSLRVRPVLSAAEAANRIIEAEAA